LPGRRRGGWLVRRSSLGILDLLEHLAHARPHQVARLGLGVAVPAAVAGDLARIDLVVHAAIVGRRLVAVKAG
jgi:hypothetical protein